MEYAEPHDLFLPNPNNKVSDRDAALCANDVSSDDVNRVVMVKYAGRHGMQAHKVGLHVTC